MGVEENQTYAECPAECEEIWALGVVSSLHAKNNNIVSAGNVTVTIGFTGYRLVASIHNRLLCFLDVKTDILNCYSEMRRKKPVYAVKNDVTLIRW